MRLRRGGVQPGPWPMNRQAGHAEPEEPVGDERHDRPDLAGGSAARVMGLPALPDCRYLMLKAREPRQPVTDMLAAQVLDVFGAGAELAG